ncbi:hypothetical protein B0J11DRAFT_233886 [Dendryphion nanum]|uniref:BTB/POZ domain-containing protein n=1 Tax=Dendryphion nanum TaxID=256645 RepID=A0A9P9CZH5_9PLEO|nr:hypothetical protein B0J11DRAFT_233886 [Dendryphion nanum]
MPHQSGRTTPRDFAYQSTDQAFAHQLGGAETATTSVFAPQAHDRYEADQNTNAPSASPATNQTPGSDATLRFPDFSNPQSSLPSQAHGAAPFPNYNFSAAAGGPLIWDWNNSIEFSDFSNHYEPQGELVQELQNQTVSSNDFTIPLPVSASDPPYQSPQPPQSAVSTNPQNPFSPPLKPPQRPAIQTGMKRKIDSEPNSAISQTVSAVSEIQQGPPKRPNKSRSSSSASITSPIITAPSVPRRSSMTQITAPAAAPETLGPSNANVSAEQQRKKEVGKGTGPQGRVIDVSKPRKVVESPGGHDILPAGKVFPIQIGSELFRLSGASLSSDAPSYFSHFFTDQLHTTTGRAGDLRTLYIDRDPDTFRDIALHLQGYHIIPRDGEHYVKLFADAQFYSLPRLTKQLFSTDIFVRIGGRPFQIPRDIFSSPGDSPNYFSLGFAQFFSTPTEVFPGLDRNALLRPPSISPPIIPNKNGDIFAELIKILQGYKIEIRNEEHRAQLLRDARYFHLKGLEQRLIPCEISYNLSRNQSEILIRLEDIRQSGVSFKPDGQSSITSSNSGSGSTAVSISGASPDPSASKPTSPAVSTGGSHYRGGLVSYARPYTDDHANHNILILEISGSEHTTLHLPSYAPTVSSSSSPTLDLRTTFHATTLARITSLFSVIASKMGLPATQPLGLMMLQSGGGVAAQPVSPANSGMSERRVRVRIGADCEMEVDGERVGVGIWRGEGQRGRVGIRRVDGRGRKRVYGDDGDDAVREREREKEEWVWGGAKAHDYSSSSSSSRRDGEENDHDHHENEHEHEEEIIIKRAHWRLRVEPLADGEVSTAGMGRMQVVLCGVRIEGFSRERSRNYGRGFLGS